MVYYDVCVKRDVKLYSLTHSLVTMAGLDYYCWGQQFPEILLVQNFVQNR